MSTDNLHDLLLTCIAGSLVVGIPTFTYIGLKVVDALQDIHVEQKLRNVRVPRRNGVRR